MSKRKFKKKGDKKIKKAGCVCVWGGGVIQEIKKGGNTSSLYFEEKFF